MITFGKGKPLILVGVDGSPASERALAWALHEAVQRGARVQAVTVWSWEGLEAVAPERPRRSAVAVRAQCIQDRQIDRVLDEADDTDRSAEIVRTVTEGAAGKVLVDASADADLLVVGTRGNGAIRNALLGSVSQYCMRHALCPVIVMPPVHKTMAEAPGAVTASLGVFY